ncbi:MAG: hypothetical protein HAW62_01840 [Endozoicomonadaceae bacterium]|nr:hypothetical protein [Endozoicomonadaceae bacterium]
MPNIPQSSNSIDFLNQQTNISQTQNNVSAHNTKNAYRSKSVVALDPQTDRLQLNIQKMEWPQKPLTAYQITSAKEPIPHWMESSHKIENNNALDELCFFANEIRINHQHASESLDMQRMEDEWGADDLLEESVLTYIDEVDEEIESISTEKQTETSEASVLKSKDDWISNESIDTPKVKKTVQFKEQLETVVPIEDNQVEVFTEMDSVEMAKNEIDSLRASKELSGKKLTTGDLRSLAEDLKTNNQWDSDVATLMEKTATSVLAEQFYHAVCSDIENENESLGNQKSEWTRLMNASDSVLSDHIDTLMPAERFNPALSMLLVQMGMNDADQTSIQDKRSLFISTILEDLREYLEVLGPMDLKLQ